jgi:hypothetical protein
VLELALLVDDFLQAARGFFSSAHVERAGDQVLHGVDLAAQPAVVVEQLADVFQQQLEQAQQQFLLFAAVAAAQFDLVAQLQAHGNFASARCGPAWWRPSDSASAASTGAPASSEATAKVSAAQQVAQAARLLAFFAGIRPLQCLSWPR